MPRHSPRPAHKSNASELHYHSVNLRPSSRASKPDISPDDRWRIPMKALVLAALIGLGAANGQASYHAPAYNYYQNNWTANG
jgi:hypothetical protein